MKPRSSARRVDRGCGAVAAIDSGQVINPDGIRNQTEGGILQSMSWTLYEAVTFDDTRITSTDWSRYPILRFASVPETVDVHIIDRPDQPFLGTGEAAQGPTSAAVANAIRDIVGKAAVRPAADARADQGGNYGLVVSCMVVESHFQTFEEHALVEAAEPPSPLTRTRCHRAAIKSVAKLSSSLSKCRLNLIRTTFGRQ